MASAAAEDTGGEPTCHVCGQAFPASRMRSWAAVRPEVSELILAAAPGWREGKHICRPDLARFRRQHVEQLLANEKGELDELDREVVASLAARQPVSRNTDDEAEDRYSFGERLADRVAEFGGSWSFIISFVVVLIGWMALNVVALGTAAFDPYPFILLNLVLSCVAALQAPVIMMSQRRQETRDRLRAENDYRVNLKSELEIRQLNEKIDHLFARQWEKLVALQQMQIETLEDGADGKR